MARTECNNPKRQLRRMLKLTKKWSNKAYRNVRRSVILKTKSRKILRKRKRSQKETKKKKKAHLKKVIHLARMTAMMMTLMPRKRNHTKEMMIST